MKLAVIRLEHSHSSADSRILGSSASLTLSKLCFPLPLLSLSPTTNRFAKQCPALRHGYSFPVYPGAVAVDVQHDLDLRMFFENGFDHPTELRMLTRAACHELWCRAKPLSLKRSVYRLGFAHRHHIAGICPVVWLSLDGSPMRGCGTPALSV